MFLNTVRANVPNGTAAYSLSNGANVVGLFLSAGTPEAVITAPVGSICSDYTNGDLYKKTSGTGNTGWGILASGSGATNLAIGTVDGTTVQVTSDTGNDATLPAATGTSAGVMPAADKVKTDFITVTQAVDLDALEADVADLTTLSGVAGNTTNLGTFSGSTLGDNLTIKDAMQALETFVEGIVAGMVFDGTWDATTANPLASMPNNSFRRVSVAGTTSVTTLNLGAVTSWAVGDFLLRDNAGNVHKMDNTDPLLVLGAATNNTLVIGNGGSTITLPQAVAATSLTGTDGSAGLMSSNDKFKIDTLGGFSQSYGDGTALAYTVTHSLGSQDVGVNVYRVSDGEQVYPLIARPSANTVLLTHAIAPTANQYRVVVSRT